MPEDRFHRGVLITLVLAVLAAGGAGCATYQTHRYAEFDPAKKGVFVIANDIVIPDPLPVSKSKKEVVHWASFPGTTLKITFEDDPPPFRINCNNNHCESGPADASAQRDKAYAYHAKVTGGPAPGPDSPANGKAPGDPKVIIEY